MIKDRDEKKDKTNKEDKDREKDKERERIRLDRRDRERERDRDEEGAKKGRKDVPGAFFSIAKLRIQLLKNGVSATLDSRLLLDGALIRFYLFTGSLLATLVISYQNSFFLFKGVLYCYVFTEGSEIHLLILW
ncbi:hypothetical protein NECAME_13769 [Necator americanus]|uniref:Uncharacterized protein n=1 Tax=Necator americanus TaxID=51031 RepID=W2SV67_NECAM|nr:hypothetical protein NECAME_13769 [Necator americanus]ETN72721.1 hypothetical protein NECAME_13769 [Necator americanus]